MSLLAKALFNVFKKPSYVILALVVAFLLFLISIWLPSARLIKLILFSEQFDYFLKIKLLMDSFVLIKTNFGSSNRILIIILSFLGGINVSLLFFYLKRRIILQKTAGLGVVGIVSGLVGVGCAACGSVILTTLVGFSATAGFMGILPFNGLEFGFLGVLILLFSIYLLAKKINNPNLCHL